MDDIKNPKGGVLTVEIIEEGMQKIKDRGFSMASPTISYSGYAEYTRIKKKMRDGNVLTNEESMQYLHIKSLLGI